MKLLVSFCGIFKNEAANIRSTLESVRPWVDRWTIVDTGSTDGTQDIIRSAMEGVPGQLFEESFVDFAATRNRALDLDRAEWGDLVEFSLMLSGNETLHGGQELRTFLAAHAHASEGAYCVQMQQGTRLWPYTRVLRRNGGWRYVGRIHERPVAPNGEVHGPTIPGVRIVHAETDPARKLKRLRELDLRLLTEEAEDSSKPLYERAHAMFFLAETHALLAAECGDEIGGPRLSHQMAAMALYFRYALIAENSDGPAHDFDRAMYAYFLFYHLADKVQLYSSAELVPRLEILVQAAPKMAGARFLLAEHSAHIDVRRGLYLAEEAVRVAREAKNNPALEVTDDRFEWLSLRLAAICAHGMKRFDRARALAREAIAAGAPESMLEGTL